MKIAVLPPIQVEPEFLAQVESVLTEGESVESCVEAAIRVGVERRRRVHAEFIARGLRARAEARRTGECVDADAVIEGLQSKLDAAGARIARSPK